MVRPPEELTPAGLTLEDDLGFAIENEAVNPSYVKTEVEYGVLGGGNDRDVD